MNNDINKLIKNIYNKSDDDLNKLSKNIDKYLIPKQLEKEQNGEVSTPYILRNNMLDLIPDYFWSKPHKVLEPSSGKGGFIIDIINRFMKGLSKTIPNKEERYRIIVEECLYFSDINEINININKCLLDNYKKNYKLNYNLGDTLKLNIKEKWGIDGFDAIIGNPPFNKSKIGTGNSFWQHFTRLSLNSLLKKNGYLLFVHPPGWRKPCNKKSQLKGLYKLMTKDNSMIYLNINNSKEGKKIFNCLTRFDYYLIIKNNIKKECLIIDEKNNDVKINLHNYNWIPNYKIKEILDLLSNNNLDIIMNSSYHAIRNYVSTYETEEYKYPLIHSTPKNGIRYKYSKKNDKGHFNIPKIIFGEGGIHHIIIDIEGKYGMTQGAIGIKVKNLEEALNLKKALLSKKFKSILDASKFGNYRIDANIFKSLDKFFWKKFI